MFFFVFKLRFGLTENANKRIEHDIHSQNNIRTIVDFHIETYSIHPVFIHCAKQFR